MNALNILLKHLAFEPLSEKEIKELSGFFTSGKTNENTYHCIMIFAEKAKSAYDKLIKLCDEDENLKPQKDNFQSQLELISAVIKYLNQNKKNLGKRTCREEDDEVLKDDITVEEGNTIEDIKKKKKE
jgi:hypothetical protein